MLTNKTAQTKTSALHFARFEFKYVLSAQQRRDIEKELAFFLQHDAFVADKENHSYPVRSLYYDDRVYSAFYDKADGLHSRSKFRLRTYGLDSSVATPLFLEIKGRHNNLVYKHRTPVSGKLSFWKDLSSNGITAALLQKTESCAVRDQFEFESIRKGLQPLALIDYRRRPYISKFDPGFRLTFDDNLSVTQTQSLFPPAHTATAKLILPGYTILEVKFSHHLPAWFHRVIQGYELTRISISKICRGMEVLGLATDQN